MSNLRQELTRAAFGAMKRFEAEARGRLTPEALRVFLRPHVQRGYVSQHFSVDDFRRAFVPDEFFTRPEGPLPFGPSQVVVWLVEEARSLGLDAELADGLASVRLCWNVELGKTRPAFLVWWTTQAEVVVIGNEYGDGLVEGIPEYLRREWASRRGRPGRGRLWVSPELKDAPTELDVPGRTGITQFIDAGSAAGIIIRTEDAVHLRELPGLLTTTTYERF